MISAASPPPPNIHLQFTPTLPAKEVFTSYITVSFLPRRNNFGNTEVIFLLTNFKPLVDRLVFLLFNLLHGLLNMTLGNTVDLTGLKHDSIPKTRSLNRVYVQYYLLLNLVIAAKLKSNKKRKLPLYMILHQKPKIYENPNRKIEKPF